MRLDSDRLVFLALGALYQLALDAARAPIRDPAAMRFVLAALYERSGGDRAPFDRFWRAARKVPIRPDTTSDRHIRWMATKAEWDLIARAVGHEPTREFVGSILDAIDARRSRGPGDR